MGGCRCTYRNCSVKTDGKTHLFHYPVFEKLRCHQWLLNARKLDFLNLKVSQLRNRVVCQHHFKEECFMNYKKDKLTFEAIPTEDGPFCDPSSSSYNDKTTDASKVYTILLDDIQKDDFIFNRQISCDKKANYSLKYADFLTNGEATLESNIMLNTELDSVEKNNNDSFNINLKAITFPDSDNTISNPGSMTTPKSQQKLSMPTNKVRKKKVQSIVEVPPYSEFSNELNNGKELKFTQDVPNVPKSNLMTLKTCNQKVLDSNIVTESVNNSYTEQTFIHKEPKVKILSEKKIQGPITISGKFEIVSPSSTLNLSEKFKTPIKTESLSNFENNDQKKNKMVNIMEVLNVEYEPQERKMQPIIISEIPVDSKDEISDVTNIISLPVQQQPCLQLQVTQPSKTELPVIQLSCTQPLYTQSLLAQSHPTQLPPTQTPAAQSLSTKPPPTKPLIKLPHTSSADVQQSCGQTIRPPSNNTQTKLKITPERIAAIEKKRKFNMKLKDIVESCLNKLDEPLKNENTPIRVSENSILKRSDINNSISGIKNRAVQEYTIQYLESRMKKMENNLISKIEQNTQNIVELKNSVGSSGKHVSDKKHATVQTSTNEESYKKFLYQEISKYLSPDSNNKIYEELFINKYSVNDPKDTPKRKRRKYF